LTLKPGTKRFSLSLDDACYKALHSSARAQGRSMSTLIRAILTEYIENDGKLLHFDKNNQINNQSIKRLDETTKVMVENLKRND